MLPYVRYQETNGDTYLVGTEGRDRPIHYRPVHLGPAAPVKGIQVDNNGVGFLAEDPTFNFALAQALEGLNDPGTLAEVSRFCILTHQINAMQGRGYYLECLANEVREMQWELMQESAAFHNSILKCRERLVAGKVRARVIRTLQWQAARGLSGSRFYSMENGPARHNIFDDANLVLEGLTQGALDVSQGNNEVAAEIETPQQRQKRNGLEATLCREIWHYCRWCHQRGHFNKACLFPHTYCECICEVPPEHAHFIPVACGLKCKRQKKCGGRGPRGEGSSG